MKSMKLWNIQFEEEIGDVVSQSIIQLLDDGLTLSTLELVGFSLGAQIGGYVARNINSSSSNLYTVPRVVGLDPARFSMLKLSPIDATFVMTVHTGNIFGDPDVRGDVAFYVNGGVEQPMCKIFYISE